MNPKPILLIVLFLIAEFAISQEEQTESEPSKTTLGINLGGSLSKLRGGNDIERHSAKAGFLAGINFELALGKNTALKTNFNYEKRTYGRSIFIENPYDNVTGWYDADWDFSYITIPVMFKYSFGTKQLFFVNSGPFAGFLTTKSIFKSTDIGIAAGAGAQFKMEKGTLVLELRNNLGLTDYLGKLKENGHDINHNLKTNSLSLIATYNFDL